MAAFLMQHDHRVPLAFLYQAAKTADQRLVKASAMLGGFLDELSPLGSRLGCLLVQLPPSLEFEPRMARGFFTTLRRRFERGPGAPAGGTGLGLSIVEAAIEPAGGVLEFSQGDGGFAACLRFPPSTFRCSKSES